MSAGPVYSSVPEYLPIIHADVLDGSTIDHTSGGTAPPTYDIQVRGTEPSTNLMALTNAALAANPYVSLAAYDPTTEVGSLENAITTYEDSITNFTPATEYNSAASTALTRYNADFGDLQYDDVLEAAYRRALKRFQIEAARYTSAMEDINAVHCDAFVRGLAIMEGDMLASLQDEEAKMLIADKQLKMQYIISATGEMLKMIAFKKLDAPKTVVGLRDMYAKTAITANQNYYREEAEFAENDARWGMEVYSNLGSFFGALSGAPHIQSQKERRLLGFIDSTAANMTLQGAGMGSIIAGPAGALIGGALGFIGSQLLS